MPENPIGATSVDAAVRMHSSFPRAFAGMTGVMLDSRRGAEESPVRVAGNVAGAVDLYDRISAGNAVRV